MLEDLKVIELASVLAGPAVGMFFTEMGATVLKIENKRSGGDVTRNWRLPNEDKEAPISAYYASVNWDKELLMLDLQEEDELEVLYHLVEDADVLITNYKAGAAQRLKVDYKTLRALNPKLIYGAINGFGEANPRVAFDVVLQAESGFMFMNGQPDGPPTKMPVALIDVLAAHQLKEGLLLALLQRERSEEGGYVSVSLLESALTALANQATNYLMAGHVAQRMGSLHPNIAPYGDILDTSDGKQVVLAVGNDEQFAKLCQLLGMAELAKDPRFAGNPARVQNRQALRALLEEAVASKPAQQLLSACHEAQIPIGQIRNMEEVFELEAAQDLILEETIEGQETKRLGTVAFYFTAYENWD